MNKIAILILFLLMPFLGFLIRMTTLETADLISKITKTLLVYIISLLVVAKYRLIDKECNKYLGITLFLAIPYLIHFFFSKSNTELFNIFAMNELIVLLYMIIIFIISSMLAFKANDYYFLIWSFVIYGIALAVLSIWFSISIKPTKYFYMYVGKFLRAGTGITDSNMLAAILNICSIAAITVYLIEKNILKKFFSLLAFFISQAGRFLTFSTGGFFSIIISLIVLFLFLKGKDKGKMTKFILIVLVIASAIIMTSGMGEILFYRLKLSDEAVKQSSVYSRLEQHTEFIRIVKQNPLILVYGVGSARLPELLGLNITLHNSYLRPLAIGGISSFVAIILLYWLSFKNFQISFKYSTDSKTRIVTASFFAAFIGWLFQLATLPADVSGVNLFFFSFAYSLKRSVRRDYENRHY